MELKAKEGLVVSVEIIESIYTALNDLANLKGAELVQDDLFRPGGIIIHMGEENQVL